jgi:glutathione S-transferase
MLRLFHFPLSPFCRKVRLTLAEKRLEVELVEERYWEQNPEFLRRNPAGKVPVLRMDGRMLTESQAICEYLDDLQPEPPLLPKDPAQRYEVRRLCAWSDDTFHHEVTANLLYERLHKKLMGRGFPDSDRIKTGVRRMRYHLGYLDWLLENRRWLAGNVLTLADFTVAAQLSCLDYVNDVDWDAAPAVKAWYMIVKSRPSFRPLLADQVPGFQPSRQYADLDF